MSVYPPPLSQSQIFNPTYFSETTTAIIGGGSSAPAVDYLEFPDAQGAETFSSNAGDNTLVVGASELSIGYDKLSVPKGIAMNGQGFAFNNGTTVSTTTWAGLQTKIEAIQALAPASDSTTLNVNDAITIQNGESPTATNTIIISTSAGDNQLLLNDDAGTVGYVLTSGGAEGSMSWAVGGGGGSQNLASVLAVSPAGEADDGQNITLSKTNPTILNGVFSLATTNLMTEGQITLKGDLADTPSPDVRYYQTTISPDSIDVKRYDTILGILNSHSQMTDESVFISSYTDDDNFSNTQVIGGQEISITNKTNQKGTHWDVGMVSSTEISVEDKITTNKLSFGANSISLNGDIGTAGYVLTSGGDSASPYWSAGGGVPSLAEVLDISPAGVANLGQSITIPAGDILEFLDINAIHNGDGFSISAQETINVGEIYDYTAMTIQGFNTFRTNNVSDPKTEVSTYIYPALTTITDVSGDLNTTATQLTNTTSASSILLKDESVVAQTPTTNSSVEMTNSALTLTTNFYSENPVITSTNVISPTTMVITNGNIPQTTTFSATGMGTGSTTQPLNINAPFTLVSPVIDTPDLPLCYTPYAGYGDALVVYNNVGVVPDESAGYAEVIFQNISATSQSSNIIAICESDGDYMTMGQVSQTATNLYDTLFEIRGAGYMSSTGHQIMGANSSSSADKSVVIAYGNGTGGFQVSPSGAIAFDATPNIVDDVVSLQDGDFGDAGQYLVSQGDASPPLWTSPSTQQIVSTSGNVNSTLNINSVIGVLIITPTAGTTSGRVFFLPNPPPPVGYILSVNNLSGIAWTLTTTETNGYVLFQANRTTSANVGINASGVLRYLGNIDFSGTTRPCWTL